MSSALSLQTVYGSLMHHRAELLALADAMHAKPYVAPPKAPVLYIKPANTFAEHRSRIVLPAPQVRVRGCLGLVFKKNMPIAAESIAKLATNSIAINEFVDVALFADFTLPHNSFFRPPVKYNCFDGSLGLPASMQALTSFDELQSLEIQTWVNGICAHRYSTADYVRNAAEQLAAVNTFINFEAGDVLMLGCPPDAPLVGTGDVVEARAPGLQGTLHTLEVAA